MLDTVVDGASTTIVVGNPAFGLSDSGALRLPRQFNSPQGRRYLVSRVARDHWDLRAHIQRIFLMLDSGDPEETMFAALVDLFLALGDKGHELREAMLQLAKPALHEDDYHFLVLRLVSGLQRADAMPMMTGSVLDRALIGNCHLVERQRAEVAREANAVDTAAMHLEGGNIREAVAVLETALLNDVTNVAVEAELLEIYRRSRDEASFLAMRRRLETMGASLGAEWDEL